MSRGAFVLILEGPDAAGKTTIAQGLATDYDAAIWHNGVPDPDADLYERYLSQIKIALQWRRVGKSVVIDRSFLSEVVYGSFRGGSRITQKQLRKLERFCRFHRVVLLGVWAPHHVRKQRIKLRGEKWSGPNIWAGFLFETHFRRRAWGVVDTSGDRGTATITI